MEIKSLKIHMKVIRYFNKVHTLKNRFPSDFQDPLVLFTTFNFDWIGTNYVQIRLKRTCPAHHFLFKLLIRKQIKNEVNACVNIKE